MMKELSVIIVNYNTREMCGRCVGAVLSTARATGVEIIVVDNSSDDREKYSSSHENVIVIADVKNAGFGNACNIGAGKSSSDALLFLNSDAVLHEDALDRAYSYFTGHPEIGVLGIRTILRDGSADHNSKRGFPTPARALFYFMKLDRLWPGSKAFGGYHMTYLPDSESNEVDAVSGSFMMISKSLFCDAGGFDESFFMYGEDLDLCYRVKQRGYKVFYYADASMLHLKGQSGLHTKSSEVLRHFYGSMNIFYDKHYKKRYGFFVSWIVRFAISSKQRISLAKLKNKDAKI